MSNTLPPKTELTPQGKSRKQSMLDELQIELDLVRQVRLKRRQVIRIASLGVFAAALGALAWSVWLPSSNSNSVTENNGKSEINSDSSSPEPSFAFASIENNRDTASYVVSNTKPKLQFETLSDDELLGALNRGQENFAIGKISGETKLIPVKYVRQFE